MDKLAAAYADPDAADVQASVAEAAPTPAAEKAHKADTACAALKEEVDALKAKLGVADGKVCIYVCTSRENEQRGKSRQDRKRTRGLSARRKIHQ